MPIRSVRLIAALSAAIAWLGLALQLALLIGQFAADGKSTGEAIWRFVGFFTIAANVFVAIVASAMALLPDSRMAGARTRLAAAATIALVGITYSVALRHIWNPTGWQMIADHALHDASPLIFLIAWLLFPHGTLRWRDALWALPLPTVYFLYALIRGSAEGWYAYWFLDPASQPPAQFALSVALLLGTSLIIGLLLVAIDRALGRSR